MSYILEALKKAEAERRAAPMPAVPPPHLTTPGKRPPSWRQRLPWPALAALGVALASAAWFSTARNDATPPRLAQMPKEAPQAPVPVAVEPKPVDKEVEAPKPKERVARKPIEKKRPPRVEPKPKQAPEPPIATLRELPEQIQREIPVLSVSGYIYAGNKADRSVLVNKRLLREGDEVAPGLKLEQMTPDGMVLNYKGYRYRAGY